VSSSRYDSDDGATQLNRFAPSSNVSVRQRTAACAASRRDFLSTAVITTVLAGTTIGLRPLSSFASDSTTASTSTNEGIVSTSKLASLLKPVPTFAIVDARGVPFFVVGEDAKLTSYFFLSYGEAKRILDVANKSSDKAIKEARAELKTKNGGVLSKEDEEEIGTNPWKTARITSVPLDLAVSLSSKGKLAGAYFRLAPSESDIEDALALDGSEDLPEGKAPLFYIEDMTITTKDADIFSPLYFQKEQLITDWKQQQKKEGGDSNALPSIKVTELFATLTEMLRPGGTDEELKTLVFVPPVDSKAKAEKVTRGEKEPFRLGERIIVL
jgi:hypothetical protein